MTASAGPRNDSLLRALAKAAPQGLHAPPTIPPMTPPPPPTISAAPVLLYDGACGLCAASVRFVLRHETRADLRFAPLQGTLGAEVISRHPELATVDSMMWLDPADSARGTPEQVSTRSTAAFRVAEYLGGWWRLLLVGRLLPRSVRDALYSWVARHRHRLGWGGSDEGDGDGCRIPMEGARNRFLA